VPAEALLPAEEGIEDPAGGGDDAITDEEGIAEDDGAITDEEAIAEDDGAITDEEAIAEDDGAAEGTDVEDATGAEDELPAALVEDEPHAAMLIMTAPASIAREIFLENIGFLPGWGGDALRVVLDRAVLDYRRVFGPLGLYFSAAWVSAGWRRSEALGDPGVK